MIMIIIVIIIIINVIIIVIIISPGGGRPASVGVLRPEHMGQDHTHDDNDTILISMNT